MSSKLIYYCAAGASCLSINLRAEVQSDFNKRVLIDNTLIKLVDGTPKSDFVKMLKLENAMKALQNGSRDGKGLVDYAGEKITLKTLVEVEKNTHNNAEKVLIKNAIEDTTNQFETASKDYLSEARGFKDLMLTIIQQWASLRGREDSQLCQWGKQPAGEEFSFLKRSVNTATALDLFFTDLACFMKDLRHSCPHSAAQFKKMIEDTKKNKKSEL